MLRSFHDIEWLPHATLTDLAKTTSCILPKDETLSQYMTRIDIVHVYAHPDGELAKPLTAKYGL
jgi:hypothetical protein